jgi:hypothetical protein
VCVCVCVYVGQKAASVTAWLWHDDDAGWRAGNDTKLETIWLARLSTLMCVRSIYTGWGRKGLAMRFGVVLRPGFWASGVSLWER